MLFRRILSLAATVWLAAADSQSRNPLQYLAKVEQPEIQTSNRLVNAFSRFDLTFNLDKFERRFKLSLHPNDDVIPAGATVNYLDDRGRISHSESMNRKDHKVYKGTAKMQRQDGSWKDVGWARVTVHEDGPDPLFEGAFTVDHDSHHLQLASSYSRTKHPLDPELEAAEDEDFMVVYRDSDISPSPQGPYAHTELKRSVPEYFCRAHELELNKRRRHPVFPSVVKKNSKHWGAVPFAHLFSKRQIDSTPGTGNTGVVDLSATIGNSAGCPTTKKVALVGIATDCGYTQDFPNRGALKRRVVQLMNSASHVWESTFNITLGLQNLTVSPANCPGTQQSATPWNRDCNSNLVIQDRLNLFSAWRGEQTDTNSYWTLLTKCNTGSAVGLAWTGLVCVQSATVYNDSQTGTSYTSSGANVVALTSTEWQVIAHETGHTFGAVHDCDSQTCQDQALVSSGQCCPYQQNTCDADAQFIMNPYTQPGINSFSPCTVGNICSAIGRNSIDTSCLSANQGITTITGQNCGNGIVEEGEDCDCGSEADCAGNTCCNPDTCKFINGAVCDDANQDCCNNCQFAPSNTVCRPSNGVCDPEEKCPGDKAACPKDVTTPDGNSCSIPDAPPGAGSLTCASGQCTSRNLQCQTVMGAFTRNSNDTYACDDNTCVLSCGSPAFPSNVCYSLQQNMLDGTPCGGGGQCQNGQCAGSSFGEEVVSWINQHKGVVIGVSVGVGVLILIFLVSCFCGCFKRKKRERQMKQLGPGPPPMWNGPPPPGFAPPPPPGFAPPGAPGWQRQPPGSPSVAPVSPLRSPNQGQPWSHETQQGWRPPQSPGSPGPSPLYGNGILGARSPPPQSPPQYPMPPPPGYFSQMGPQSRARYA